MLRSLADDLHAFEDVIRLPLGIRMPARSTVVRLEGDRLVLISPLAIDADRAREIDGLGEVCVIVAPNVMHDLHVGSAAARWPRARVLAPAGFERKVPSLAFAPLGSAEASDLLGDELLVERVAGVPSIEESVLYHPRSRTLVVTDLVFNVHGAESWSTRLLFRLVGAWKELTQSRSWKLVTKDRAAASSSVARILAWDFDRLLLAHGDVVASGAHAPFAHAVRWMASGASRPALPRVARA